MTLRDEILEQPEVAAPVPGGPGRERRGASPRRCARAPPSTTSSSPRAAPPTTPRSTPSTCSASGIGCRSGSGRRRSSRSTAPRRTSRDALVIGISQSGASPDIVGGHRRGPRARARPTIAITNEPDSALAAAADRRSTLGAGPERAIAATKTYTAELLAVAAAVGRPGRRPGRPRRRRRASPTRSRARSTLEPEIERDRRATRRPRPGCSSSRRGFEYATAREWALKLKELARVFADPYSAADFQHGPLALVEPGVPVLAVVRSGAPGADLVTLLGRLRTELGGDLMVVSDRRAGAGPRDLAGPSAGRDARVARTDRLDRRRASSTRCTSRAPAASIPKLPRNLSKVTRTT